MSPGAEILLRESVWLRSLVAGLVRDQGTADDIAQDVAVIALQRPPGRFEAVRGWLATVARRVAGRRRQRTDRAHGSERAAARQEAQPSAYEVVGRAEAHRHVVDAVLALEEPYRTVILLRFFEGHKTGAIADALGCPVATVRTRLARGMQRLRGELEPRFGPRAAWPAVFGLQLTPSMATAVSMSSATGVLVMGTQGKVLATGAAVCALGLTALWWSGEIPPTGIAAEPDPAPPAAASATLDTPVQPPLQEAIAPDRVAARSLPAVPSVPRLAPAVPDDVAGNGLVVFVHDDNGRPVANAQVWQADGPVVLARVDDDAEPARRKRKGSLHVVGASDETGESGEVPPSPIPDATPAPAAPALNVGQAPRLLACTDRRGVCRVASGKPLTLVATESSSARISTYESVDPVTGFDYVTLCIGDGTYVSGTVVDPDNKPVAAAAVHVVRHDPATGMRSLPENARITTDASGRFACVLPPGVMHAVAASHEDLRSRWCLLISSSRDNVRLQLAAQNLIVGRVLDGYGGACVEATVRASTSDIPLDHWMEGFGADAVTGPDGSYRLLIPGLGKVSITAAHPQWAPTAPMRIALVKGHEAVRADFRLTAWANMTGEVRWSDGRPIEGATITVVPDPTMRERGEGPAASDVRPRTVQTDARGRYALERLVPDRLYTVTCVPDPTRPGARAQRAGVPTGLQSFTFEHAVTHGHSLQLRLLTPSGEPFTGAARVAVLRLPQSRPDRGQGFERLQFDTDGHATVSRLERDSWVRLVVISGSFARAVTEPVQVGKADSATLRLEPACRLQVQVAFAGRRPAPGALVRVARHTNTEFVDIEVEARADRGGLAVFEDLPAGEFDVSARQSRTLRGAGRVTMTTEGTQELRIDLRNLR